MDIEESLVDLASLLDVDAKFLKIKCWDVLKIGISVLLPPSAGGRRPLTLTFCIVQAVVKGCKEQSTLGVSDQEEIPNQADLQSCANSTDEVQDVNIFISPLMYEIMCTSATAVAAQPTDTSDYNIGGGDQQKAAESQVQIVVSPLPLPSALNLICDRPMEPTNQFRWTATKIDLVKYLPAGSSIGLSLIYMDDELLNFCEQSSDFEDTLQSTISFFLAGRILSAGSTTIIHTDEGMAIALVNQIEVGTEDEHSKHQGNITADVAYQLKDHGDYRLIIESEHITMAKSSSANSLLEGLPSTAGAAVEWRSGCPGYDSLLQSMIQLVTMKGPAAPTGILLTGSPQVGKTHLASCVAYHLSRTSAATVHWVSVQDLILQATWADESDLLEMLRPPPPTTTHLSSPDSLPVLLVLDDLHIFAAEETSDAINLRLDPELLSVKNAILQIIDEMAWKRINNAGTRVSYSILGIAQSSIDLPFGFVKCGRLEKEVVMLPPTESQREVILRSLIPILSLEEEEKLKGMHNNWAEALTPVTVGCVAGDLRRILSDAWTRAMARGASDANDLETSQARLYWDDLKKAAQTYVPIQLETVDVCKPMSFLMPDGVDQKCTTDAERWATIHKLSWESFGGYPLVKKRLWRTVVGPWRRFLKSLDLDDDNEPPRTSMGLSPPPGVLFHGESGNGKSCAAECLASSMGLPMIRVKAADVMDKWLGGSEAIIRSLFARARSAAPCILFFDELDSIATNRATGDEGGAEVMSRLLSTLLNEMDGISNDRRRQSVLVLACTNRLEDLDAALLRPGRLEEHIQLKRPDFADIRDILRIHLSKVPVSEQVDLDSLAQDLANKGASGAEVEGVCHEACLGAIHRATASDVLLMPDDIEGALHSSSLNKE